MGRWKALWQRMRRLPWWRFSAGVAAGAAALLVTFVLRLLGLGLFLPEAALAFVVTHIPGAVESAFIDTLGEGAKFLGLATAVVGVLAAFGIGAVFFRRLQARLHNRWVVIGLYTFASAAIILLVVLPLLGDGIAGSTAAAGTTLTIFSQLVGGWVYASVLDYLLVDFAARYPQGFSPSRRQFFVGGLGALAAFGLALYGFSTTIAGTARLFFGSVADLFGNEVTPVGQFYVVTKNVIDPTVNPNQWSLQVSSNENLVRTPLSLSFTDLQGMPQVSQYTTMECVSNEVGGNLLGTAKWTGVRLADLLIASGLQAGASWVEFVCVDGYTVAIPLALAMMPTTLVVLRMNDALLADQHGAPARILVPGKYGMFSAKWVSQILVTSGEVSGFWQQKGWTDVGFDKTTAIIATPGPNSTVRGALTLGGIAYAGARGISRVEVSTDGGASWSPATLKPPLDPQMTWVLWTFAWTPPSGGAYRILARAYEADGTPQIAMATPPFPDGASGYDSITLYVSS